jgi:glycosyltransferase involved in cell wall biosynthesis
MDLSIVISIFNEEESLAATVEELRQVCPGVDYLVINDGSTDGTERVCEQLGLHHLRNRVGAVFSGVVDKHVAEALRTP